MNWGETRNQSSVRAKEAGVSLLWVVWSSEPGEPALQPQREENGSLSAGGEERSLTLAAEGILAGLRYVLISVFTYTEIFQNSDE